MNDRRFRGIELCAQSLGIDPLELVAQLDRVADPVWKEVCLVLQTIEHDVLVGMMAGLVCGTEGDPLEAACAMANMPARIDRALKVLR